MTFRSTGSLHDPRSRVVDDGTRIIRLFDAVGQEEIEAYLASPLPAALGDRVVSTTRLDGPPADVPPGDWVAAVEHERLPLVSHPYEWTFAMLRDAALLHLEVTAIALEHGFVTKDATPYNVQFVGTRPVFIDVGSFEPLRGGEPWYGYRQFCQLFLNPLLLQSRRGVDPTPWLRGTAEGISPTDTARLLPRRTRLRPSVFPHVTAHAWAERRYHDRSTGQVRGAMRSAGLGPAVLRAQVAKLRKLVESLRWRDGESTWSGYSDRAHYGGDDLRGKEAFVEQVAGAVHRRQVLDIGANDGRFSELVAPGADSVVAVDLDAVVIDRLYRRLRDAGGSVVLPLHADLTDLSGGLGWVGRQRSTLVERLQPDLVLALAVVHHLVVSRSIPVPEVVDLFAGWSSELVLEVPHIEDPMVQRLVAQKQEGSLQPYGREVFDAALRERFEVVREETLPSGTRTLYHARPR